MRAALNTTYDAYYGPNSQSGTPGTRWLTNKPCRVVPATQINKFDFPFGLVTGWLTAVSGSITRPFYTSQYLGQWQADISTADQIAVPSGTTPQYYAIRLEGVNPIVRTAYDRIGLLPISSVVATRWLRPHDPVPLPPPPLNPCPLPGATCALAWIAGVETLYSYSTKFETDQWWVWPSTVIHGPTTVAVYVPANVGQIFYVYTGPNCSSLTTVTFGDTISTSVTVPTGSNLYVRSFGTTADGVPYNVFVS